MYGIKTWFGLTSQ